MQLTIEQLQAVAKDIQYSIDAVRVVMQVMPPDRAYKALHWRRHYLRDIGKLLREDDDPQVLASRQRQPKRQDG